MSAGGIVLAQELFRSSTGDGGLPHLVGSRCRECSQVMFPARAICSWCGAEGTDPAQIGQRGRVRSSAVVYHAPTGFVAPYLLATVELEEGPVVFCPLTGCAVEEGSVPTGTPVQLVIAPARPDGKPVFQYQPTGG